METLHGHSAAKVKGPAVQADETGNVGTVNASNYFMKLL
jgi:hypothetical protein